MRSSGSAVPVEDTVRALRRLAPGASLRSPETPELRLLAAALRDCAPGALASRHPGVVARVVLAAQLRALRRAMTGFFGAEGPETARLVRAARRGAGELREPGLRAAALGWAEVRGHRVLAGDLRGVPVTPDGEDGRVAAELAVAALLPEADGREGGGEILGSEAGGEASDFLDVRSVRVGERGFRVDVDADPPVELRRDGGGLVLRSLWWNGLGRVADDLGYEYLLLAKDAAGAGTVRHWCHPRPAAGARVLRLESAGYRGERLRLDRSSAGSCAEVLVKLELTVRLGA
ncbi:hypothetical protein [Amycolatopsis sp. CA-128772]|uniref:hypothetical protein n=1 Tax=Amycolatopsis sp. CA-128772 TaxID=2073159 RepID=UPI000CD12E03|nr:hypothetical protein [Amycolatopsis sp. CA-128772]